MSLVNDALNRARAEAAQRERRAEGDGLPPQPPPVARARRLPIWVLPALAAIVVLAVLVWRYSTPRRAADLAGAGTGSAVAPLSAASQPVNRPAPLAVADVAGDPTEQSLPSEREPILEDTRPGSRRKPSEISGRQSSGTSGQQPPAAESSAAAPARPTTASPTTVWESGGDGEGTWYYVGSLSLPGGGTIELGGIAWSATAPSAVLNGSLLSVGSEILGLRVAAISERTVTLEGRGKRYALQLGAADSR